MSSSSGPCSARRACRLLADTDRAAVVIVRSLPSIRPATSQPRPIDTTVMIASAIPDSVSNWFSSAERCSLRHRSVWLWSWDGDTGDEAVS